MSMSSEALSSLIASSSSVVASSSAAVTEVAAKVVAMVASGDYLSALITIAVDKGPWTTVGVLALAYVNKVYLRPGFAHATGMVDKAHLLMDKLDKHIDAQELRATTYTQTHEAYKSDMPLLKSVLEDIREAMVHGAKEHGDLASQVARLTEGKAGALTSDQVVNLGMVYTQKVMWDILIWWEERLAINGMLGNEERIKSYYDDFCRKIKAKYVSQMGMYRYDGVSLDRWVKDGVDQLLGGSLKILWEIQVATASSVKPRMQGSEIAPWLSHRVSAIQGAAKVWLADGKTLGEYLTENPLDADPGTITWLGET